MNRPSRFCTLFPAALAASVMTAATAAPITGTTAFADFATDGDSGPFTLTFTDRPGEPANGVASPWTVAGGVATYANDSRFNDVATALVQTGPSAGNIDFSLSVDVSSNSLDFNVPRIGLVALASNPSESTGNFNNAGIYAYVEANGNTNGNTSTDSGGNTTGGYDFNIASNGNILATSDLFDITFFNNADFTITMTGFFDSSGDLTVTAVLDSNQPNVNVNDLTLTTSISGNLPSGDNYGLRINNTQGNVEIDIDNLSVAIPEPSSLALVGLGGLAMLGRTRRSPATARVS